MKAIFPWLCLVIGLCVPASVFAVTQPPGIVIDHEAAQTGRYIGSPSIVILSNGDYIASHDFFGPKSNVSVSATTRIFRSADRGQTWTQLVELQDQFWSNLFVHRKQLYLMGTDCEYGRIVIRKSSDGGSTWSPASFLTSDANFHTAPVPVIEHHGRLWRAFERHPPGPWGHFEAFMMSASSKADLLQPESWKFTEKMPYPVNQSEGKTWLEGNAVLDADGSVLDILRVDNIEKIAITEVEGGTLRFKALAPFPGGSKKFTIRFDRKSKRYWTLSNPALSEYPQSATQPGSVRNTLTLMSSKDLQTWKTERTILSHPDPLMHGFQYVDWQFDRQDIVAVVRTAFDDDSGGAHNYHDANYMIFHRIGNYRK